MTAFYEKALAVCEKHLTGSARNFLDRQIVAHLNKSPETLLPADKEGLVKWCRISGALLLGTEKAEQLSQEILSI